MTLAFASAFGVALKHNPLPTILSLVVKLKKKRTLLCSTSMNAPYSATV